MKAYQYQWQVLGVLFFTWGVVGLSRYILVYLFPHFSVQYGMGVEQLGVFSGLFALCWAIGNFLAGKLVEKFLPIQIFGLSFALMFGGVLTAGFISAEWTIYSFILFGGFGCGLMAATSIAYMSNQSNPKNRGMFMGIMQAGASCIGLAVGSIVIAKLAIVLSWQLCFLILAVAILVVAVVTLMVTKRVPHQRAAKVEDVSAEKIRVTELLKYKNVIISIVVTIFLMAWAMILNTYTITFLTQGKDMDLIAAGAILSSYGLGNFVGAIAMSMVSDFLGRKRTLLLSLVISTGIFCAFVWGELNFAVMMAAMFFIAFLGPSLITISISVIPSESVPGNYVPLATALTPAVAELFGGVMAPVLCGFIISALGVQLTFQVLIVLPIIAFCIVLLFLKETAPRLVHKTK